MNNRKKEINNYSEFAEDMIEEDYDIQKSKEEDLESESSWKRNSKITKKSIFPNSLNVFEIKEKMSEYIDNKKLINNYKENQKPISFTKMCLNLEDSIDSKNNFISKYFITLLHLSNEKNMVLQQQYNDIFII
jgi:hypothetical protein